MAQRLEFIQMYEVARLSPFFAGIEDGETFTKLMPQLGYYGDRHFLYYHKGDMGTAYYEKDELESSAKHTFQTFTADGGFDLFKHRIGQALADISAYLDRLEKIDLGGLSQDELISLIQENSGLEAGIFSLFNVTQPQNFKLFESHVRDELGKHSGDQVQVDGWLGLLCTSEEPTQLSEEELDWLKLVRMAKRTIPTLPEVSDLAAEHPEIYGAVEDHFAKYKLLSLGDGHWEPDIGHFLQNLRLDFDKSETAIQERIDELTDFSASTRQAKQALTDQLNLSDKSISYCRIISESGHLRFRMRMEGFIPLAEGRGIPIFSALAAHFGLSAPEFTQMTYLEFLGLAAGDSSPDIDELKRRLADQHYLLEIDNQAYRFYFGSPAGDRFRQLVGTQDDKETDMVQGSTAMGGKVRGRVCLFRWGDDIQQTVDNLQPDPILVAGQTRPQLMPLIRACIGIITDEGGIMSHSAIVARELKLPCVVGTKNATKVLRHGDLIELDAAEGTVRVLARSDAAQASKIDKVSPVDILPPKKSSAAPSNVDISNIWLSFESIGPGQLRLAGGKGLSLASLTRAGIPVPAGFVITSEVYSAYFASGIPEAVRNKLLEAFDSLNTDRVAVRSSATAEDSADASWAGQFESFLSVTRDGLIQAVEACWRSAQTDTVGSYAQAQGINEELRLAVVVQAMVDSEVSGVAFTANPVTKNPDEIMIEAVYGLGELLVQGLATPDNYLVSKHSRQIVQKHVAQKDKMLTYDGQANAEKTVGPEKANISCLTDNQIAELAALAEKIERHYGSPQDIEWALSKNQFYIVQSRPITTL